MDFIIELFNVLSDQLFPNDTTRVYAIAPAAMFALQALPSVFQYFGSRSQKEQGIKDLRKAEQAQKDAISAMRAVEIQNKLEALQVPTLGAEVQERAITRGLAGTLDMLGQTDAATALGGATRAQIQADASAAQIAANLDALEAQRDRTVLTEDQRIELEKKQRELDIQNMILGGAGLAAADAQRLQQMGQYGQMQALGGIATAGIASLNPYGRQRKEKAVDTTAITEVATPRAAQAIDVQTEPSLRMPVRDTAGITTGATPTGSMVGGIYNPYANYNSASSPPQLTVPEGYNPNALPGSTVGGMYNPYTSLNTGAMVGGIYNPYANYSAFSTPVNQ